MDAHVAPFRHGLEAHGCACPLSIPVVLVSQVSPDQPEEQVQRKAPNLKEGSIVESVQSPWCRQGEESHDGVSTIGADVTLRLKKPVCNSCKRNVC